MLTGEKRSQIDRIWNTFWSGGISNPLTVIEQFTYLLFIKRLDDLQITKEFKASLLGEAITDPVYPESDYHLRWSRFKELESSEMLNLFTQKDGVFDFMRNYAGSDFQRFMKGATFLIPNARLLQQVVDLIDQVSMTDQDTKGDIYEYLLSKLSVAKQAGQFRTPRHLIKLIVELMAPTPKDIVCDPSAGSCGFLVGTAEYLSQHYRQEIFGNPTAKEHFEKSLFMGMEFDATMIRIGAMNLLQHGIESPQLYDVDALSEANSAFVEKASLILANPPFKGTLDQEAVEKNIAATVSTKKTELLFLALILRGLKIGGRAAVIVPDGVLFGSSKAHTQIRKEIIENHQLQAVISLPSGVFKPYAGVSTAVLIFTKTNSGGTQNVWFYDLKADGYSLDDKRQPLGFQPQTLESDGQTAKSDWTLFDEWLAGSKHEDNNLADVLTRWQNLIEEASRSRTEQSFLVPLEEIRANGYDLSINRYKEVVYEAKTYDRPEAIIEQIQELDRQRQSALELLKEMFSKDSVVNA